jgi:hypothetical protein
LLPSVRSLIKEGASLDEVFAAVAGTVGGSAAVAANSAEGQMKRLSLTIGETKESIGAAFLPILERLLPVLQKFAVYVQNNTDKVLAVMAVVGSLAGAILALNAVMKVITVTQLALNLAMAANPIGLVVTAVALLVAGFGVLVAKTGSVTNAFKTMGNFIIGVFESIANSYVSMINLVIRGLNLLPGVNIGELSDINLPRFSMGGGGGSTASGSAPVTAGPDRVERMIQLPSIPAMAGVSLPAPTSGGGGGGGGGGGRGRGGARGESVTSPGLGGLEGLLGLNAGITNESLATFLGNAANQPINITINSTVADERLGDTIVNALKQYNRRSGPLDVQIA